MAFLNRIIRFNPFQRCGLVRHLTSNNVPISQITLSTNNPLTAINVTQNSWIWQRNDKIESPILNRLKIDFPNGLKYVPPLQEPCKPKEVELPTPNSEISKEAARLIVIRRNKMKRHKLKKLRKRMKFEWAKRRQKREWNKEKLFQAVLIQQCKQGEEFSAEKYVEERLSKLNELTQGLKSKKKGLTRDKM